MKSEQEAVLKNVMAILHDATYNKKERYTLQTTDYNGTRSEIVTRAEYLEFVVNYAEEQLGLEFGED